MAADLIQVGDYISLLSGNWVQITDLHDTEEYQQVYNLRVAEDHTYFTGGDGCGYAVWTHNAYSYIARKDVGAPAIQDVDSRRYVNQDETALTSEKEPTHAKRYGLDKVDEHVRKLNDTLGDLVDVLTQLPGVTQQLTKTQVKGLFVAWKHQSGRAGQTAIADGRRR